MPPSVQTPSMSVINTAGSSSWSITFTKYSLGPRRLAACHYAQETEPIWLAGSSASLRGTSRKSENRDKPVCERSEATGTAAAAANAESPWGTDGEVDAARRQVAAVGQNGRAAAFIFPGEVAATMFGQKTATLIEVFVPIGYFIYKLTLRGLERESSPVDRNTKTNQMIW